LEVYKPLGSRIKIEFEYNNLNPSERTRWNRIGIIRPRKVINETSKIMS